MELLFKTWVSIIAGGFWFFVGAMLFSFLRKLWGSYL